MPIHPPPSFPPLSPSLLPLSYPSILLPSLSAPDKEKCQTVVRLFLSFLNDESLLRFIKLFLLQSNSTSLRWRAHSLLHTLYLYSTSQVGLSGSFTFGVCSLHFREFLNHFLCLFHIWFAFVASLISLSLLPFSPLSSFPSGPDSPGGASLAAVARHANLRLEELSVCGPPQLLYNQQPPRHGQGEEEEEEGGQEVLGRGWTK